MFRGYGREVEEFVRVAWLEIFRLLLLAGMVELSTTTLGVFSMLWKGGVAEIRAYGCLDPG